ncbi:hypothetical protein RJ639_037188 [Escallonia herrerae]|uniref:Uncharacterized protein n=1 Tax=Escallonia herrerae TaxID=1293975 RepID=A0AA88WND2_9ASTE|nr:hypothetical protein RJ639_037188 [Escallonia herrerae]
MPPDGYTFVTPATIAFTKLAPNFPKHWAMTLMKNTPWFYFPPLPTRKVPSNATRVVILARAFLTTVQSVRLIYTPSAHHASINQAPLPMIIRCLAVIYAKGLVPTTGSTDVIHADSMPT